MSTKPIFSTSSSTTTARRVARAAMIVMVGGLLSGVAAMLLNQIKIRPFGLSFDVPGIIQLINVFGGTLFFPRNMIRASFAISDEYQFMIYLTALSVPLLIFNLRGVLASSFLPEFVLFVTRGQDEDGWRLASAVANWLIIGSLLMVILTPWLVRNLIAPGLPPESTQFSALSVLLIFVSTVIFSLSGLMMSLLNAYEHFLMPAITPAMYYIGVFFGALVLTSYLGLFGLALGVLLGALAGVFIQWLKLRQFGAHYTPTLGWRDPVIWRSLRHVARLLVPSLLSTALMSFMLIANANIASRYAEGTLTYLDYAQTITVLPTTLFALSIAIAIFPTFSRMAAKNNQAGIGKALAQTLRGLLFVAMPLAVAGLILRVPIIQFLFERGEFSHDITLAVASAAGFYSLLMIPYFLIEVIHRAFFAIQDTLRPALIAAAVMIVYIALSLVLTSSLGPLAGLPLANVIAATMQVLLLLWVLSRKIGGIGAPVLLSSTVRFAIAAGVMGTVLYVMLQVPALISLPILVFMPLTMLVGGIIYFATAWRLGIEEARLVLRIIQPQK